ncbi:MAG: CRISPR-associated endonuclease Cas2 [Candidatus Brocadia sp.]|jgi:CRISPR-associated protein Cas2|uniref:CRISPR-associated endoribonuclease Cas2 n=1 Tax=Candidatus Brocadia fulgida TaxID=380242 RepID=A0A0M2UX78_9BACT|nr:MAG: hypothetical protein BROFUL_02203 [Candidatus Brocadia fulgida]UJS22404.1 MAG: CRISPR-associated endonuclease Cas2 [Candidatus Brocadia sp.]
MNKLFTVVAYDISDDKRRTKLHQALKKYGKAVQFSAFECLVTAKEFAGMIGTIHGLLKKEEDKLRIYTLCDGCYKGIKNLGTGEIAKERHTVVV